MSTTQTPLRTTLLKTTRRFLATFSPPSQSSPPTTSTDINPENLLSTTSKTYTHTIGPTSSLPSHASSAPKSAQEFIQHLNSMSSSFDKTSFRIVKHGTGSSAEEDDGIMVDEVKKVVVVSVAHKMVVKGRSLSVGERTVENEVTWWLWFSEDGGVVKKSHEVLDGVAAREVGRLVGVWKGEVE